MLRGPLIHQFPEKGDALGLLSPNFRCNENLLNSGLRQRRYACGTESARISARDSCAVSHVKAILKFPCCFQAFRETPNSKP